MRGWAALPWVFGCAWLAFACGSSEHSPQAATSGAGGATTTGGTTASGGAAGGSAAGGVGNAAPIAIDDLCPIFTHDLCLYLMQCGGARYRDADHCERELSCFGLPELTAAAKSGAIDYDPAKVGACHERFVQSPCTFGFFLFTPDIYDVLQWCPGTVTPKQKAGGACSASGECSTGLYCYKGADYACPGACKAYAQVGEDCTGSARCADELTCQDNVCKPKDKAGDSCTGFCSYSVECAENQVCPGNLWCDDTAKKCALGRLAGEPCGANGTSFGAEPAECAINLWCDKIGNGVGACQKPSQAGSPCNDGFTACAKGLHCVGYTPSGAAPKLGTCQTPGAAGTDCRSGKDCAQGLACVSSHCQTPGGAGANCNSDDECQSAMVCASNHCAPARYPGDACDADRCTFSRCVNGTCDYHAKVGEACAGPGDCATGACVAGLCYDDSICKQPAK